MIRFVTSIGVLVLVGCNAAPRNTTEAPFRERTTALRGSAPASLASATPAAVSSTAPGAAVGKASGVAKSQLPSSLKVKRLVVTTGVKDREPLASEAALPGDGSTIYAFAELSNLDGESENVRITFERKGGAERVGNVTLPVPGKVVRHRTWASTRFIRAAGVWEAVLWSESGSELERVSFEVASA